MIIWLFFDSQNLRLLIYRITEFAGFTGFFLPFTCFLSEGEFFLSYVAAYYCYYCDDHFGRGGVEVEGFDEDFETGIVDEQIAEDYNEITYKLGAAAEIGRREGDIFLEQESHESSNREN